ncbi:MAG: cytochrome c oxidase subunit 3 [Acidobacteria bacterium]|nr:cytochrome c oxidase subunit 3 [Acidobacteriota bacterium]
MMREAKAPSLADEWSGGSFPYRIGHRKLGMWLFIMSDTLTFAALLIAYSYVRFSSENWPKPFPFFPSIIFSSVMTLVLLSSSLTMVFAVAAAKAGRKKKARYWILGTMFFGTAFIVLHGMEWSHLIHEGLYLNALPADWAEKFGGSSILFGSTFFGITGLHMFHVFTGVLYLGFVALRIRKMTPEDVETSGLYWHFVDLVWMFVFPLIYLMSIDFTGH